MNNARYGNGSARFGTVQCHAWYSFYTAITCKTLACNPSFIIETCVPFCLSLVLKHVFHVKSFISMKYQDLNYVANSKIHFFH